MLVYEHVNTAEDERPCLRGIRSGTIETESARFATFLSMAIAQMQAPEADIASLDLAAIAGRVRQLLNATTLDGTDFASKVGVPYGTMRAYVSGARPPSAEFLVGCYRGFGFMPSWVLTGEGAMTTAQQGDQSPPAEGSLVPIRRFDVHASAGHGLMVQEYAEYAVETLSVSATWLMKRRLSPINLRVIHVRGNSMQGVLADGDLVLVDQSNTTPRSGFVYLLRQGDELLVKYCEQLPGGVLRISSANPAFQPYDVDLSKSHDVTVLGRVVASMHDW